ncbi:MAG: hypothetical protein ACRDF0_09420 [Candidatus Limnocylindria bacterium]
MLAAAVTVGAVAAAAVFISGRPPHDYVATLESYYITEDPRRIVVRASVFVGDEVEAIAAEDSERVTVTVRVWQQKDVFTFGEIRIVPVELREPLGNRRVVDASSQRVLTGGELYTPAPTESP